MNPNTIKMRMILAPGVEHPDLAEFNRKVQAMAQVLAATERRVAKNAPLDFRVFRLSMASPPVVEIEAAPQLRGLDKSDDVLDSLIADIESIQPQMRLDNENHPYLTAIMKLGPTRDIVATELTWKGRTTTIDAKTVEAFEKAQGDRYTTYGSRTGVLLAMDLRPEKPVFEIYPSIGGKIRCRFGREQTEDAIGALGKYVVVSGCIHWRDHLDHPVMVDVDGIEVLKPLDPVPDLAGIGGRLLKGDGRPNGR